MTFNIPISFCVIVGLCLCGLCLLIIGLCVVCLSIGPCNLSFIVCSYDTQSNCQWSQYILCVCVCVRKNFWPGNIKLWSAEKRLCRPESRPTVKNCLFPVARLYKFKYDRPAGKYFFLDQIPTFLHNENPYNHSLKNIVLQFYNPPILVIENYNRR